MLEGEGSRRWLGWASLRSGMYGTMDLTFKQSLEEGGGDRYVITREKLILAEGRVSAEA